MRVYFSTNLDNPKTGKGFFLQRLAKSLEPLGVEIIRDPKDRHDISIYPVKIKERTKSINVVRLDGVYHDLGVAYKSRNRDIAAHMNAADAVVYQSPFGKRICDHYLGQFRGPTAVIFNGADPEFYTSIAAKRSDHEHNFIAASRWRPHKRLPDIIESFLVADLPNSCLYIAGDLSNSGLKGKHLSKYQALPNVQFLGRINQLDLGSYYKLCRASIHICWVDCCPNSVVEAICACCPVICNNIGGTPELVAPSGGIVCELDKPYNLKPVQLYQPPAIDRQKIAEAMKLVSSSSLDITFDHVEISTIAEKYFEFFTELLR